MTHKCPLSCAHCCFSASASNQDKLSANQIIKTIKYLDNSMIKMVAFTGGEPFLLGQTLIKAVHAANQRGFKTRIVTSGYFGENFSKSEMRLKALEKAGLKELSISWDDFHAEFIPFEYIRNVFWAAKKLGLVVGINIVQGRDSNWTAKKVRQELGVESPSQEVVQDSPLNFTGRAELKLRDAGRFSETFLGPCPYVLAGPALNPRNKLLACCGVIPETNALILDHNFAPENLNCIIEKGHRSSLLNWIYLQGPYAIMEWISKRYSVTIPNKMEISGNCEACYLLFNTKGIADKIHYALAEKSEEILGELIVLNTLGLLNPIGIRTLKNPIQTTALPS